MRPGSSPWPWSRESSRAGHQPQTRGDDREAHGIEPHETLAEKRRADEETEDGREEEVGAHPARLAMVQDPEPEHRGADAQHDHQIEEAHGERGRPFDVRTA